MQKRWLGTLGISLLLAGLLAGCTTMAASREDLGGLPRADTPEYMMHPLRLLSLGANMVGSIAQYAVAEPIYFGLSPVPEFAGLSLEERRYLEEREEAWRGYFSGERPAIQ